MMEIIPVVGALDETLSAALTDAAAAQVTVSGIAITMLALGLIIWVLRRKGSR